MTEENPLKLTLEHYQRSLLVLESSSSSQLSEVHALDILMVRDRLQEIIDSHSQLPPDLLLEITKFDRRLKKRGELIAKLINLVEWRNLLKPDPEAWWWWFPTRWEKFDWLWNALSITAITISLSLIVDTSTRLLSAKPDTFSTLAVVGQSVMTLLAGGGALTKAGREALEKILIALSIPPRFWQEISCGLAWLLMLSLLGLNAGLPRIAVMMNQDGMEDIEAGRIETAAANFQRAIALKPDYAQAHLNLGMIYEELRDFERAIVQYEIASNIKPTNEAERQAVLQAYSNLSRRKILDQNYSVAASVILSGLDLIETEPNAASDPQPTYELLKNLGWTRLEQGRLEQAETILQDALKLEPQSGEAHCLLAETFAAQGNEAAAIASSRQCMAYADSLNPNEDALLGQAQERLQEISR
ncbi:Tetratricopeptide TPR_2 repeat-containing protein [Thalassoporum mexicanum PCC 7367]|uniref:tetratricopeptide repeat protein n=1 Tax=Thalassoporum mexicanum TaxID=3457544 RepID=UPI00029F8B00|nr:tetratricopeptide repeat protein [Pseudanabaena sp. PCC 7367]AFY70645.1 Tetratricopeptide TPR_2 repeat-containing protein [Pseudanabaena sp. PCC 7367]